MILEKTMSPKWLSNSWLVADRPGGHAIVIDTGGPPEPLLAFLEQQRLTLTHVLCTHHHIDHVAHTGQYVARFGCPVCGHGAERDFFRDLGQELDTELNHGDELSVGDLRVRALHIPGHTTGQLAFLVNEAHVFTGDTLFRGSVGGTRGTAHATFEDLQTSVMDVLMALDPRTEVHPGHTDSSTIGREWSENPFVRRWRGVETESERPCSAFGRPAQLLLRAPDYDGGTKCWVRFVEDGSEAVVPGSRVE